MSKKPKTGAPAIDMTAMVDVAFLLLTFFILTTTRFREEAPLEVEMASSVSQTTQDATGLAIISIGDSGQVFLGLTDIGTRIKMVEYAAEQNKWKLTPEAIQHFSNVAEFGVPMAKMEQWLNLDAEQRKGYKQPGMTTVYTDSATKTGNDLREWIYYARRSDPAMRFAIKGDVDAEYIKFKNVISTLQDWEVNQYALITKMEKPAEEK
jgi:biopolymer transport protein ExbD